MSSQGSGAGATMPRMKDNIDKVATAWLPPAMRTKIEQHEQINFLNLVKAVEEVAVAVPDASAACAKQQVLLDADLLLDQITTFLECKNEFDVELIYRMFKALYSVVIATESDTETQSKWVNAANLVLAANKEEMRLAGIVLDWQEYWNLLQRKYTAVRTACNDGDVAFKCFMEVHSLCKQAKNLFSATAATQIWEQLRQPLEETLSPASFRALMLLLTFFPHKTASIKSDVQWHTIASEAVDMWQRSKLNSFWDRLWLCFLSRLAKWDTQGAIEWPDLLRPICNYCMNLFRVPVGNYMGPGSTGAKITSLPFNSMANLACNPQRSSIEHLGKLLMYTIRPCGVSVPEYPALGPMEALKTFATLLDHFYQVPNAGEWSAALAAFLESMHTQLISRRLVREAADYWVGNKSTVKLDLASVRPAADVLYSMASVAVFHKDESLSEVAPAAVAALSCVLPDKCLPFVVRTIHETLASAEAVHRTVDAISLFSGCVRPLLIHGLPDTKELGEFSLAIGTDMTPQQHACLHIGQIMEFLLPAVDANDEDKLTEALNLFNSVFYSTVKLSSQSPLELSSDAASSSGSSSTVSGLPLGVDLESWAVELIKRLVHIGNTLECSREAAGNTDDGDAEGGGTSFGREPFFMLFASQFFQKLPDRAAEASFRKLVSLSGDLQDDGTAMFLAVLITHGCSKFPELAVKLLLRPNLDMLEDDISSRKVDDVKSSRIAWLATRMTMLKAVIDGLHSAGKMQPHVDEVVTKLISVSKITSPTVPDCVCDVLSTILSDLCSPTIPMDTVPHASFPGSLGLGVATWVAMDGTGAPQPSWLVPTEEDHTAAKRVSKLLLDEATSEVKDLAETGKLSSQGPKERWRLYRALQLALSVVFGLLEVLEVPLITEEATAARLEDATERSGSIAIARHDPYEQWRSSGVLEDSLKLVLTVLEKAGSSGPQNSAMSIALVHAICRVSYLSRLLEDPVFKGLAGEPSYRGFCESPCADLLQGLPIGTTGPGFRVSPLVIAGRLSKMYAFRLMHSAASPGGSSINLITKAFPEARMKDLRPVIIDVTTALLKASRHRYADVSTQAVEAFSSNLTEVCTDLALAVVPELIGRVTLIRKGPGCSLADPDLLKGELESISTSLLNIVSTDWVKGGGEEDSEEDHDSQEDEDGEYGSGSGHDDACDESEMAALEAALAQASSSVKVGGKSKAPPAPQSRAGGTAGLKARLLPKRDASDKLVEEFEEKDGASGDEDDDMESLDVCTKSNQHLVIGPLKMLQDVWQDETVRICRREPEIAKALFLMCMSIIRYDPTDVKAEVNETLDSIRGLFVPYPAEEPGLFRNAETFGDIAEMLTERLLQDKLHWREAFLAQMLLSHLVTLSADAKLVALAMQAQLFSFLNTPSLICKYTAMYSLSHVLLAAGKPDADDMMYVGALAAATTAAASSGMGHHMIATLLAMKNTSMLDLVIADSGPEAMIMVSGICGPVEDHCDEDCGMFVFHQPGVDTRQGEDEDLGMGQSATPSWTAVQFISGLVRYGPEKPESAGFSSNEEGEGTDDGDDDPDFDVTDELALIPVELQLKEVLQGWAGSEHKDRLADGSPAKLLEVVMIEVCLGLISGAVMGKISVSAEDSEGDEEENDDEDEDVVDEEMAETESESDDPVDISWVLDVMSAGYSAAEVSKGNLWASAFASAGRIAAKAVVEHEQSEDEEMKMVAAEALSDILKMAKQLTTSWKGRQPHDMRHVSLMSYMIDNLMQEEVIRKSGRVLEVVKAVPRSPEQLLATPPTPDTMEPTPRTEQRGEARMKKSEDILADALFSVLETSVDLVAAASKHSRQAVRATGAALAATVVDTMVNGTLREHSLNAVLCARMQTLITETIRTSALAVASASSEVASTHQDQKSEASLFAETVKSEHMKASTVMSNESLPEATVEGDADPDADVSASDEANIDEREAAIGFTSLFVSIMRSVNVEGSAETQSLMADLVSWSLTAQGINSPDLQSLMVYVRQIFQAPLLPIEAVPVVLDRAMNAASSAHWQVRLAAIISLQPFWHRNFFALTSNDLKSIIDAASLRLRDGKVEVRQSAMELITGILQCMCERDSRTFREAAISSAATLFPVNRRARRGTEPKVEEDKAAHLTEQHACTLALGSVLLSSPYILKPWTTDVVMALARAAGAPPPAKVSAVDALQQFRANHEGISRLPLRERLEPDVWDALRDAAVQSSYFA